MRNRLVLLFMLTSCAGFSGAAVAESLDQQLMWMQCADSDPDRAIVGCTALI